MLLASCHCGAVVLDIENAPESLTECTCSICRRYGAKWAYYTRRSVRVRCSSDDVTAYVWGDKTIEFYHCNTCGCLTHDESVKKDDDSRIAVNARLMEPDDIKSVPVRLFDGASTWQYLNQ